MGKTLKIIGNNIRQLRLEKKMSQEELAYKAKVHRTYIGHLERAERNVSISTLEKISEALGIKPIDLLKE